MFVLLFALPNFSPGTVLVAVVVCALYFFLLFLCSFIRLVCCYLCLLTILYFVNLNKMLASFCAFDLTKRARPSFDIRIITANATEYCICLDSYSSHISILFKLESTFRMRIHPFSNRYRLFSSFTVRIE